MKLPIKQLVIASAVGTIGVAGIATAGIAGAETANNATNPMSSLVDKIASTFNLDKSKVQAVFDAEHTERQAEHDKKIAEKLQSYVDNGTITSAQKTAIEAKLKELKAERQADKDSVKDMTDEERKATMEEKRKALETWAKDQGIDLSKLKGVFGGHGGPHGE